MILNQEPILEGSQLNKSKDSGLSSEICCNQCACSLILYNWISTSPEAFIHRQQEVFAIVQTPPCSVSK